MSDNTPEAIHN